MRHAKVLETVLRSRGINLVSGGTDSHLLLLDLRGWQITGAMACDALARAHIVCNKNSVPNDPQKPTITSGLRIGTPAGTTRGFGEAEFEAIGHMIADVLEGLEKNPQDNSEVETAVAEKVSAMCRAFPIYQKGF